MIGFCRGAKHCSGDCFKKCHCWYLKQRFTDSGVLCLAPFEEKAVVGFSCRCEELAAQYEYIKIEAAAADRHRV